MHALEMMPQIASTRQSSIAARALEGIGRESLGARVARHDAVHVTLVVHQVARTCQRAAADRALKGSRVLVLVLDVFSVIIGTVEHTIAMWTWQAGTLTLGGVTIKLRL